MNIPPVDEKAVGLLGGLIAAVIFGWRIAKRMKVSVTAAETNGNKKLSDIEEQKLRIGLLSSMDMSLKTLVAGQQEAFKKLDRIHEAAESVRREIAEVKGSLFGRS